MSVGWSWYSMYITHELEDAVELRYGLRCERQTCLVVDHETHPREHECLMAGNGREGGTCQGV